jgi:hypothetical protein
MLLKMLLLNVKTRTRRSFVAQKYPQFKDSCKRGSAIEPSSKTDNIPKNICASTGPDCIKSNIIVTINWILNLFESMQSLRFPRIRKKQK